MGAEHIRCPLPDCPQPATAEHRGYADGSPLPARMVKVRCAAGHLFLGDADSLGASP